MAKAIREIKVITKDGSVKKIMPIGANADDVIFDDDDTLTIKQANIESLLEQLQTEDENLQTQIDALKAEDTAINNRITSVKTQLDNADVLLQNNINILTTNLGTVTAKHNEITANIKILEDENTDIQSQINELNEDLTITTETVEKQNPITITDSAEKFIDSCKVYGNTMTQSEEPTIAAKVDVNYVNGSYTITITNGTKIQTLTLDCSQNPLFSTDDCYYKEGGNWYVSNAWTKYIFTGEEDWYAKTALNGDLYFVLPKENTAIGEENKNQIYSNCYIYKEVGGTEDVGIQLSENSHEIYIKDTNNFKTVDTLKAFLKQQQDVYVIYKLSTIVNTLITNSELIKELEALQNIMSYLNDTRISTESTAVLNPLFTITYYKNTALYEAVIPIIEKVVSLYGG